MNLYANVQDAKSCFTHMKRKMHKGSRALMLFDKHPAYKQKKRRAAFPGEREYYVNAVVRDGERN